MPAQPKTSYDVRDVITRMVDRRDFFELQPGFAANVVIGFARLNGRSLGIVASQPAVMAGVLDINASDKVAWFVRFCNAFNIPLLTFVDVRVSCRASIRNMVALFATAPRYCSPIRPPPFLN